MKIFAPLALLIAFLVPFAAFADQTAPAAAPDAALTQRFASFLNDVLAGHLPSMGLSDAMKTAFTPDLISKVDADFAPLGAFQTLQFASQDSVQGYERYHYNAVFAKGTRPLMFVLDSNGNIAGFFKD